MINRLRVWLQDWHNRRLVLAGILLAASILGSVLSVANFADYRDTAALSAGSEPAATGSAAESFVVGQETLGDRLYREGNYSKAVLAYEDAISSVEAVRAYESDRATPDLNLLNAYHRMYVIIATKRDIALLGVRLVGG